MNLDQKRAKARQKARARVFCLWAEGSFCLDLLVLLCQDKRTSLRGNERLHMISKRCANPLCIV